MNFNTIYLTIDLHKFGVIFSSWNWKALFLTAVSFWVKKIFVSYETRRFSTVFTSAHNWSVYWARSTTSHPNSITSILILSCNLHVLHLSFTFSFTGYKLYAFLISPSHAIGEEYRLLSSSSVFFILLLFALFYVQVFSSALCSRTQSALFPQGNTKFHTRAIQDAELQFCIF